VFNEMATIKFEFDPNEFAFCVPGETVWKGCLYLLDDQRIIKILEQRTKETDDLLFCPRFVRKASY